MIRKIETQEEKEKREKRNAQIIGTILGIIMLLSTAGYAFMSFEREDNGIKKVKFGDTEFTQSDAGIWVFNYGGNEYQTLFNPSETLNVSVKQQSIISDYYNKPLYFGILSKEDIAGNGEYEIIKNLQKIIAKYQHSCLSENCSEDYPIKNCSVDNIIIFKQTIQNNSFITQNQKCVTINYALGEEERASDAFIYSLIELKS